jgi:hypothetical protein
MTNDAHPSLTEQILDKTMSALSVHEEFDSETLQALQSLIRKGELSKVQKLTAAIKTTPRTQV